MISGMQMPFDAYVEIIFITFLMIVIDIIITNINSRIYNEYYMIELIPWNRYVYKYLSPNIALIISSITNILVYILYLFIPINVSFILAYAGFMLYRLWNSSMRLYQYWRMGGFR